MFYEYFCIPCHNLFLLRMPMDEASMEAKPCPECDTPSQRIISIPSVCMNEWVAEGYRRTSEPPDDLKPEKWHENLRHDMENYKVVSTPSTTRLAGTIDRPNKKEKLYESEG